MRSFLNEEVGLFPAEFPVETNSLKTKQTLDILCDTLDKWDLQKHLKEAKEFVDKFSKERSFIKNGLDKYVSEVEQNVENFRKILNEQSGSM
jgi:hypothetical protein